MFLGQNHCGVIVLNKKKQKQKQKTQTIAKTKKCIQLPETFLIFFLYSLPVILLHFNMQNECLKENLLNESKASFLLAVIAT